MEAGFARSILLSRRRRAVLGAAALFLATLTLRAQSVPVEAISLLGVKNPFLASAATNAYALAMRKLANPGCRRIFQDFRDPKGHTLQARLDSLDRTPENFLGILRFANGERLDACQSGRVLAATTPLSHVVFLCGLQFFEREHRDPEFAAALVIHEMLHSLGLGENPPASNEITAQVIERCGAQAVGDAPMTTARLR